MYVDAQCVCRKRGAAALPGAFGEAAVNQAPAPYNYCKSVLPFRGRHTMQLPPAAVTPGTLNPDDDHQLTGLLTILSPSEVKRKSSELALRAICVMYGGWE